MKNPFIVLLALLCFGSEPLRAAEENWATVVSPERAESGKPFEIKVTASGAPAGGKIGVDLHWTRKDGSFGGFAVAGPRLEFTGNGEYVFTLKATFKPEAARLSPVVFISPDGGFARKTHLLRSKPLGIAGVEMDSPAPKDKPAPAKVSGGKPAGITYKKSWIHIRPATAPAKAGQEFSVTLDYFLDPSETWDAGTKLKVIPLGPWIDNPDGRYSTARKHVGYPGLNQKALPVAAGRGELTYTFKLGEVFRYNSLLLHAVFVDPDGEEWPWRVNESGPEILRQSPFYDLVIDRPGGLFTYDEPVTFSVRFNPGSVAGETKKLVYKTIDTTGAETSGTFDLIVGKENSSREFTLKLDRKGTFLLETEIAGWGSRDHFFARIPDLIRITGNGLTQFGGTDIREDSEARTARKLGLTYNRLFTPWNKLQPAPDVWKLERMDQVIETNLKNGLKPWITILSPPAWVMPEGVFGGGFQPFPFEESQWRNTAASLSNRWKDKILGWEWLNEIVPGTQTKTPVEDYLKFCRIGAEEARKANPKFELQLAGGLWPANFRADLLKAGAGNFIDILPVHYSNLGGVIEARANLDAVGLKKVRVWDNETGSGLSTWNMPPREMLKITKQSQWVLDRWPDELIGGAERIIYFGGESQAAGNWTYLLDGHTPRPLAATLAVAISKLHGAKPLGKFFLSGQGVFHLFEKNGESLLVASNNAESGDTIALDVGAETLTVTDHQGNQTTLSSPGGKAVLALSPLRVFIEGADLDLLKRHLLLRVGNSREPVAFPQIVLIKGPDAKVPFSLHNSFDRELTVSPGLAGSGGWSLAATEPVKLAPGESRLIDLPVRIPPSAAGGPFKLDATISVEGKELSQTFGLTLISPDMIGNLLENGGFETLGNDAAKPAAWAARGAAEIVPAPGGPGVGQRSMKFSGTGWSQAIQTLKAPPGQDLLYSAWIWSQGMKQAGSNVSLKTADGKSKTLNIPAIFDAGPQTPFWKLVSKRITAPADLMEATFIPLASGPNFALYDNLRVTLYEGTNFAAEAHKLTQALTIDGDLGDWNKACPIPLLGDNQLSKHDPSYPWTPENLSAAAYLSWDDKALYVAAEVQDDVLAAPATGEDTFKSDGLTLAIHPANRSPGTEGKAFEYFISPASPGGGSGRNTLYRPASKSGGLASGQLAKDSSNYELAIIRKGNFTFYEGRIPWIELGGIQAAPGSKFGLSLELNDNDGNGRAATMGWGEGLTPNWNPGGFGVGTLVGESKRGAE